MCAFLSVDLHRRTPTFLNVDLFCSVFSLVRISQYNTTLKSQAFSISTEEEKKRSPLARQLLYLGQLITTTNIYA